MCQNNSDIMGLKAVNFSPAVYPSGNFLIFCENVFERVFVDVGSSMESIELCCFCYSAT